MRTRAVDIFRQAQNLIETSEQLDKMADLLDGTADAKPVIIPIGDTLRDCFGTKEPEPTTLAEAFPPKTVGTVVDGQAFAGSQLTVTEIPPAPPQLAPSDFPLDIKDTPWDEALHAGTADKPIKKADGTWRARRGATKKTPVQGAELAGAELPAFNAMMAKLIGFGVDPAQILESVSQAVFGDLSKTDGGIIHVQTAGDPKATGKAISCLRAIAADGGHEI